METRIPTEAVTHAKTYEGMSTFRLHKDFEDMAYHCFSDTSTTPAS